MQANIYTDFRVAVHIQSSSFNIHQMINESQHKKNKLDLCFLSKSVFCYIKEETGKALTHRAAIPHC